MEVEGALQKVVEAVEEEVVAVVVAQASAQISSFSSCKKYSQSLRPWGERREEKKKWENKKKKTERNMFIHCKMRISQIPSSQQTEDFYTALLPKVRYEQPHYSYDDNMHLKSKLTDLDQCHEYQMHRC